MRAECGVHAVLQQQYPFEDALLLAEMLATLVSVTSVYRVLAVLDVDFAMGKIALVSQLTFTDLIMSTNFGFIVVEVISHGLGLIHHLGGVVRL